VSQTLIVAKYQYVEFQYRPDKKFCLTLLSITFDGSFAGQTLYRTATWGKGLVKLYTFEFPLCDYGTGDDNYYSIANFGSKYLSHSNNC